MSRSDTDRQQSFADLVAPPHQPPPAGIIQAHAVESTPSQGQATKSPSSNLTLPRSPLIGRDHEIAAIQQLLLQEHVGLLTLTGPGGIGKTRLAMQVAANLLDHFIDGVYFVSLAPIRDPDLISAVMAQALGVREAPGRSVQESLQEYLRDKELLLVLDNFEQILAAAPVVRALLAECRCLKVLVTSRATLHLYGEQEFPVPPLALPDANHLTTASLSGYAAIDLFCQRARAVKPDFALTPANAADVAKICIGLDGLPLAIELAAARTKLFSPSALLARLHQRLTLLTGGPQDLPVRQRTLRDEIAWSYDLLTADEQKLFRRLAVFVGGFTLEAAQSIGNAEGDLALEVVDAVASLIDHNLLKVLEGNGEEARFGLLETIREYGLEQLETWGEAEATCRRHADFFLGLAEATAPLLRTEQAKGLARLMAEHANLRAALSWSVVAANAIELALRLTTSLLDFWIYTGDFREGRRWFEAALARTTAADRTVARAHALIGAGFMAEMLGDATTAYGRLEEGMVIAREQGSKRFVAIALEILGFTARRQHDDALAFARHSEALAIGREIGGKYEVASNLCHLAGIARDRQDYMSAHSLYEESLVLFQELKADWDFADVLSYLGQLARLQDDYAQAVAFYRESLARWRVLGTLKWKGVVECLAGLAHICAIQQQWAEATRLFSTADTLQQTLSPSSPNAAGNELSTLRTQLGEAAFAALWAAGCALSTEQAVDYVLALPEPSPSALPPVAPKAVTPALPTYPAGLTAREVEVLRLLTQRLTYAEIAEQLIVSRRTVNAHVTAIYTKLGINRREAAIRYAVDHHLL